MLDFLWLAGQDLIQQVVQDVAVRARETFDEPEYVFPIAHREGRHLQAGYPAFCVFREQRNRSGVQTQAHDFIKELGRFSPRKAEISSPELHRLAACSQAR